MDSAQRVKDANLKKKADRATPFVPGISALRELLDKTMSKVRRAARIPSEAGALLADRALGQMASRKKGENTEFLAQKHLILV